MSGATSHPFPVSPLSLRQPGKRNETVAARWRIPARDYDLGATLSSGQAFRWRPNGAAWEGVISGSWVRVHGDAEGIIVETAEPQADWKWAQQYFQTSVDMEDVIASFPDDPPLREAITACHGLRLLRQNRWECLASFILSSTKQIIQIQQIVIRLCSRYGRPVRVPAGCTASFAFPRPEQLAVCTESELRDCRMGFRAPFLLATARLVADGTFDLNRVDELPLADARSYLTSLPGVGRKIADCVLLFAYGRNEAFPVDVWVMKAIRELYFPGRRVTSSKLMDFTETHFGANAGYAQQYLFHYMRVRRKSAP